MTNLRIYAMAIVLLLVSARADAQPPVATPIAPVSDVYGNTIAFSWQSSPGATWYQLWLGRGDTSLVLDQWYTAEAAGCAAGGVCTTMLSAPIKAGIFVWHVRAWNPAGYAPWSPPYNFSIKDPAQIWSGTLPPSRRFSLVLGNAAVLDNETGIVWERQPEPALTAWGNRVSSCLAGAPGGRLGWRLATVQELLTLFEVRSGEPAFPVVHPFILGTAPTFFSETLHPDNSAIVFIVTVQPYDIATSAKTGPLRGWCVRRAP
jgi:hypothetical protein